jgi:crotonobetainyl-CoA:carnitine CoA-transferase CaiB-like acyl-CoA transferase
MATTPTGPLAGVVVLDLCHFLAGPYATIALADLGADVVKVEDPDHPDEARNVGPCFREQSVYYQSLNWGKQSLGVRLLHPDGHRVLLEVVRRADIVIDNYKPGVMAKLGLDHAALAAANPRVVTCSLSGFGATGPHATRPGYDYTIQARSGVMSLTGEPDGPPGKAGISYVDHSGGLAAALAVCAGLVERDRTGIGRHIDLALYDVQISMLSYLAAWNLNSAYSPGRQASGAHPSIVPAQTFQTSDGHLSLFVGNDPMWRRLCAALGDPGLEAGEYATNSGRAANRRRLLDVLGALFLTRRTQHWVTMFERVGVPCEPVNTLSQALADPQVQARSLTIQSLGAGAPYEHVRGPVPLDPTKAAVPAPALGADNWSILTGIGFTPAEIQDLTDRGALSSAAPARDLAAQ